MLHGKDMDVYFYLENRHINYTIVSFDTKKTYKHYIIRHFSLLNVNAAGACGYDFPCDGGRLVRAYLRRRRGTI